MRKWGFLGLMFGLSLLNGGFFVRDTLRLMGRGLQGWTIRHPCCSSRFSGS